MINAACRPNWQGPSQDRCSHHRCDATSSSRFGPLSCANELTAPDLLSRRNALASATILLATNVVALPAVAAQASTRLGSDDLERAASQAYASRNFSSTVDSLNELIRREPASARLYEMRAVTLVDGKNFARALVDFDECLRLMGSGPSLDRARILCGKGLAYEGLSDWVAALDQYAAALEEAKAVGAQPDPYILNSIGNCHASLGEWRAARESYLASAAGFQSARRENAQSGSLQQRLDGAVLAFSNAALMLAQLGDDAAATKEMQGIARRAAGSTDMRAALTAQYWSAGLEAEAEAEWEFACGRISTGCVKYQDKDWLYRIRRWPPVMVERLGAFLALKSAGELPGRCQKTENSRSLEAARISGFKE